MVIEPAIQYFYTSILLIKNHQMKTLTKAVFKNYPVATYYLLTLLISWGGLVVLVGGFDHVSSQPSDTPFLPLYFITVAGPFFAGIFLTGFIYGKDGYRNFISRFLKCRVAGKWYAAAILIAPLSVFTTLYLLSFVSPVFKPGIFSDGINPVASAFGLPDGDKTMLVLFVVMIGLFNGFVEEVGWSGFVTPIKNRNKGLIASGIVLGIMWGLWHLFSNYIGSAEGAGTVPLFIYLPFMLFTFLPPFRIIMMWVYRNTESLFLAILMHASLDIFWMLSMPVAINGQERMAWYSCWAVVLWMIVAIINSEKSHNRAEIHKTLRKGVKVTLRTEE